MIKECINCGKDFECTFDRAKYCSNNCKSSYRRKIYAKEHICKHCGKTFVSNIRGNNSYASFCSIVCSSKYMHENLPKKEIICKLCGEIFLFKGSSYALYCTNCRKLINSKLNIESRVRRGVTIKGFVGKGGNTKKGKDNPTYKNGIGKYREIKYEYMKQNNIPIRCEKCGSKENLEVHHKDHDRTHNYIENLDLLCKSCHKKEHIERDDLGRFISPHQ